ncbi:uncharacterized protein FMAN_10691 [Fusarium mangiferae]|uniref:Uncharacterized protein n=1 Tax=Fusarium mangiferae TaxID=192010 RepID=A0A1L7U8T3_FUSMA|nr:uncharacterized protein FMAN_10691 [Fusarium mangiferae]CVL05522.1 uncharacterized protein FMAN_10691 [Fusarium mangiferae]
MQRPKTDQEIRKTWTPLQRQFEAWYEANKAQIRQCHRPGADYDAFNQLIAMSFPKEEDQKAFEVWAEEWLGRHAARMTYRMEPGEFLTQVSRTNFTDTNSTGDLLRTIALNYMPWVPIGKSKYGGVGTFYAFKRNTNFLKPDLVEPGPNVVGDYILTMNLKSKTRAASGLAPASSSSNVFNPSIRSTSVSEAPYARARASTASNRSPTKENPNKAPDVDENIVFAQIGTLYVYGGGYVDPSPATIQTINEGPWWRNGFSVVVLLNQKGQPGPVYVVYNDASPKDITGKDETAVDPEEIPDTAGVAAYHQPGKLHPMCNQKFTVAKIADSLGRLGNLNNVFVFKEIAKDKRMLRSTKIETDKTTGKKFIPHATPAKIVASGSPSQAPSGAK